MLTPRENYIRFFKNEEYEWKPCSVDQLWFRPQEICENIARGMVVQQTPYTGPKGGKDMFGIEWVFIPTAGGSMENGILTDDIEEWPDYIAFPDLDAIDWEGCAKRNAEYLKTDKLICSTIFTGLFERLISIVGFENAAMAMIDEDSEDCVKDLFDRLTNYYIDLIGRLHRWFNVELVEFHDDWGTQQSTMFSVATHREMILPYLQRITAAAHEMGVFMEQHSCGFIETMIPNLLESGMDTWRGQSCNDKDKLIGLYGNRFKFGVEIRPAGAVSDAEAMELAETAFSKSAGKNVWFSFGRTFTPEQLNMMYTYIKRGGKRSFGGQFE